MEDKLSKTKGMRKTYRKEFKAKVASAAIVGEKNLAELASQYGVHTTQIKEWKKAGLEALNERFSQLRGRKVRLRERKEAALYEEIGKLKVELDFLSKGLIKSKVKKNVW